ncbi:MAG TPA: extensin family protein [Xanthobacteraceae bacterium]|nr:extensin family protein [Xanthobacteraceae bacterium]
MALYLVGSAILVALVGCGRFAFEQREAWRGEAEAACMRSGAVKQSATAVPIRAIDGPGICGADYPFKVAALGDRTILGYREEIRPPAGIPHSFPIPELRAPLTPARFSDAHPGSRPLPIRPHGAEPAENEDDLDAPEPGASRMNEVERRPYPPPSHRPPPAQYQVRPLERAPVAPYRRYGNGAPPLGPRRDIALASAPASVQPPATLACPLVSRLDQWMASAVQPAAQRWFGQQVAEIRQISAYSCRGMNGNPRARISEHAFGNALDIAAFTLADGRQITVKNGWRGEPEEQGFLRDVHAAACEYFSTVLAPGSNRFHYDHIHVDLARRRSGRSYCNPSAVSGELIARRAAERMATGSVGNGRLGFAAEDESRPGLAPQLPRAVPGED